MRIVIIQAIAAEAIEESSEAGRFCKAWVDMAHRNVNLVKQKDTELTFRFPRWGLTGLDAFFHTSYLHHLSDSEQFHLFVQAEKEGFDAAISANYFDPMLRDIRQAINIPMVGLGESSMLLACMMGAKFGIVTLSSDAAYDYEDNIRKYGFKERAVRVRPIPETAEELLMALTDVHQPIESFKKVARELIKDGADVLIPGCALLGPGLRMAPGAEEEYPNGLTEVDGVPVVDILGAAVKMAEMLVSLKQGGSAWISRKGLYAQATPKAIEDGRMVLKYDGPGSWDVKF